MRTFVVRPLRRAAAFIARAFLVVFVVASCTDERIVFRDRAPFNPPPAAALGFLGYYDPAVKQTTCGNCHAEVQSKWRTTQHAGAYATLAANPGQQASCYGCHTVNGRGNLASGTVAGHDAVADAAYRDVQCESCHGAGLAHVEGVGQGTVVRPLAKIGMIGVGTCADCHSGTHNPFAEEWTASRHAVVSASRGADASCAGCHEGRAALVRWGADGNYTEKGTATAYQAITCAVCHNPHGSNNPKQLRYSLSSVDPEQNLCMKCHLRRSEPSVTASSPHAPQGAVLLGDAGWRPPGFVYDSARIFGSHATDRNPNLCAGCHVARFTVTDAATGNFTMQATGHLFRAIPCLDAAGRPTADKTCSYTTTARSWQTCTGAGCHANATVAAGAFNSSRTLMRFLTDQLWVDTNVSGSMQAAPTDAGLLPTIRVTRPAEWSNTDNTITPAEGAEFNARLCGEYGQSTADNSRGAHNPFLCQALMSATINFVRTYYNMPALSAEVQAVIDRPIGGASSREVQVSRRPAGQ